MGGTQIALIAALAATNAKIIAFVATTDAAKSRAFYEGVLGLAPTLEDRHG
jgi:hypothetical protein